MDFLRGAAIIALLFFHAAAIPAVWFGVNSPSAVDVFNGIAGAYRMPLLMTLSGMLLHRSLAKPTIPYYAGKLRSLLWPYLLWPYLLWAVIYLAVIDSVSTFLSPGSWIPVTYLWFLLFVFLYYCAAPVVTRLPMPIVLLGALIAYGGLAISERGFLAKFALFAFYFYIGHLISSHRRISAGLSHPAAIIGLLAATVTGQVLPFHHSAVWIATSLTGVLFLISISAALYRSGSVKIVEYIGRDSIVFYLSHYPVMYLAGLMLTASGIAQSWAVLFTGFAAALAAGFLLTPTSKRLPLSVLFTFPRLRSPRR